TPFEALPGGLVLATSLGYPGLYYRRHRPGHPVGKASGRPPGPAVTTLAFVPVLGWIVLYSLPGVSRRRASRATMQSVFVYGAVIFASFLLDGDYGDALSTEVVALVVASILYGVIAGRAWGGP